MARVGTPQEGLSWVVQTVNQNRNSGRGERIRTSDSCVPNAVLYQAELRPEADGEISDVLTLYFEELTGVKLRG